MGHLLAAIKGQTVWNCGICFISILHVAFNEYPTFPFGSKLSSIYTSHRPHKYGTGFLPKKRPPTCPIAPTFKLKYWRKLTMKSFHFSPSNIFYTSLTHGNAISEQLICFHGNLKGGRD